MKCCICSKKIEKCPIGSLDEGGHVILEFGFGSKHDGEIKKGYICDECTNNLKNLRTKNYL